MGGIKRWQTSSLASSQERWEKIQVLHECSRFHGVLVSKTPQAARAPAAAPPLFPPSYIR